MHIFSGNTTFWGYFIIKRVKTFKNDIKWQKRDIFGQIWPPGVTAKYIFYSNIAHIFRITLLFGVFHEWKIQKVEKWWKNGEKRDIFGQNEQVWPSGGTIHIVEGAANWLIVSVMRSTLFQILFFGCSKYFKSTKWLKTDMFWLFSTKFRRLAPWWENTRI